ncbi:ABC transporter permease [Pseudooceanicola sp. MF1-13]|uniref:ABC transporter permease n=1 Tax=Pseudooceanicola sp. MF1-13 TaxID=3379095 RepID=UPI0038913417
MTTTETTTTAAAPARPMRNLTEHLDKLWGLVGFIIILTVWHVSVIVFDISNLLLPSPGAVFAEMIERAPQLGKNALITLREILTGYALAVIVGTSLGIALAFSRILSRIVYPVLVIGNSVPKVALAPLLLVWIGFGSTTSSFLAMLVAVFPMVINTVLGLTSIDQNLIKLGRVMGGNAFRIFWKVRLPTALPSIFAGLKLSITLATIGAVVGELIAGQGGLGYMSQFMAGQLEMEATFAAIVVLSAMGVTLFYLIVWLEYLVIPWRRGA